MVKFERVLGMLRGLILVISLIIRMLLVYYFMGKSYRRFSFHSVLCLTSAVLGSVCCLKIILWGEEAVTTLSPEVGRI